MRPRTPVGNTKPFLPLCAARAREFCVAACSPRSWVGVSKKIRAAGSAAPVMGMPSCWGSGASAYWAWIRIQGGARRWVRVKQATDRRPEAAGGHAESGRPPEFVWLVCCNGDARMSTDTDEQIEVHPLAGKRIAVTRPVTQAEALIQGLRTLGAEPISAPTIRIADPTGARPLRRAVHNLSSYDWVLFTSANGVERFWRELSTAGVAELPSDLRVAAIGPATAECLEARGVRPRIVPEEYVAEAMADALIAGHELRGRRVLLPRAAGARRVLPERLQAAGAEVDEVIAYEAKPNREGIARLQSAIRAGGVDMVTFTAASTVRHFVDLAGTNLGDARVAVIGPITARAAREAGLSVDAEAKEYTVSGLLQAICAYYASEKEG